MAITIKGIKINSVNIQLDPETGGHKINSSEYSLISSEDKVLAKQTIGGYGGLVIEMSSTTKQTFEAFMKQYKQDVNTTLGL